MDRTILKTGSFFELDLVPALRDFYSQQLEPAVLDEAIEQFADKYSNQTGGEFDSFQVISSITKLDAKPLEIADIILAKNTLDGELTAEFVDRQLVDGALELIKCLDREESSQWIIYTAGGESNQLCKLRVLSAIVKQELGIDISYKIVSSEPKAQAVIDNWFDADEDLFKLPAGLSDFEAAETIRIIDDKPKNLNFNHQSIGAEKIETWLAQSAQADTVLEDSLNLQQIIAQLDK